MTEAGTETSPLRVAIIGSGPAGFYIAEHLLRQKRVAVEIDIFDRLPTPFGLVRAGVAPDHQKIKSVTKVYDRNARRPNVRFYGYVEYGKDVFLDDLKAYYHQICFTTGAQTDRNLNIPGETLIGSHAATEFVAWYNGHPYYRHRQFDLSRERVAIIGVGNVAVDVARILCRTPEELAKTDIADYALQALTKSKVKEVIVLGRRGPAQAAFTNPEIKEMGELADADLIILPEEVKLDPISQAELDENGDKATRQKVQILQAFAQQPPSGKSRRLTLRFLVSPTALIGDENNRLRSIRLTKNELYADVDGSLRSRPTNQKEEFPVGLVFRSIGYRGIPLPDVPFQEERGILPNVVGRVVDPETTRPITGLYTAGWIKRGPSGVIGTNKPDAAETVEQMMADVSQDSILQPSYPDVDAARDFVQKRQPNYVSYEDWLKLDELEVSKGKEQDRPRIKFTQVDEMLTALHHTR